MEEYIKAHFNRIKEYNGRCFEAKVACNDICPLWDQCNSVFYSSPANILERIEEYENPVYRIAKEAVGE